MEEKEEIIVLLRKKVCGVKGERRICCPDIGRQPKSFQLTEDGDIFCELNSDCPDPFIANTYTESDLPDILGATGRKRRNSGLTKRQSEGPEEVAKNFTSLPQQRYIQYFCNRNNICEEEIESYCDTVGKLNPECERCSVLSPPPFPPCFNFISLVAPQTDCGDPVETAEYLECVRCDTFLPGGHFAAGREDCIKFSSGGTRLSRGTSLGGLAELQPSLGLAGSSTRCPKLYCQRAGRCCRFIRGGWGGYLTLCPHAC